MTVAALLVALSSCSLLMEKKSEPSERAAKSTVQKIDPAEANRLELGQDLDVVATLPRTLGDDPLSFSAFLSDHELVGSVTPRTSGSVERVPTQQSRPVIFDLTSKKLTAIDVGERSEPTDVGDVSGNRDTLVWVEVADYNIAHSTFTIHAFDRDARKVTTLGTFDDPSGKIAYGNDLALAGRTAYFSTTAFPGAEGKESVFAVPVDGSASPRVIAAGGQSVHISDGTLTYQVRGSDDETAAPQQRSYDLRTRQTTPIPASPHADDPGFCGAETTEAWEAWCTRRSAGTSTSEDPAPGLLTIEEKSGRTTEFDPFPVDSDHVPVPHGLVPLGRWTGVTMTTETGQDREFLIDLDTREINVFPDNTSFGSLSPDRTAVLVSSYAGKGPGLQRIVRIPTA